MSLFVVGFLLGLVHARPRVVGGWDGSTPSLDSPHFPWHVYTHIRYGGPVVFPDGHAKCNLTQMAPLTARAHAHNISVLWAPHLDAHYITEGTTPPAYWKTIRSAVEACNVDGIEVDYEHPNALGIVTADRANRDSRWLATLRRILGKPVSADIATPGVAPGNWILGWGNWINTTMLNRGDFDYVNSMSYHWSRYNDLWAWKKDIWILLKLWGIDPSRINVGVPLYSERWEHGQLLAEPTWRTLSPLCPHIPLQQTTCDNVLVVSKQMSLSLGALARKHRLGGFFPWTLSYDSYEHRDNTLTPYLLKGYAAPSEALLVSPMYKR